MIEELKNGVCSNNYLYVKFHDNREVGTGIGGIPIIRPDKWLQRDEDGRQVFEDNKNGLETKPQICTVIASNPKYPYSVGDVIFVHYMAFEVAQNGDIVDNTGFIIADYVFFTILEDGNIKMADSIYIGEQVYTPEKATESGLIYDIGGKKETMQIMLTNVPDNLPKWHTEKPFEVGDLVISCDPYNYEFAYNKRKLIRLTYNEIACKILV